MSARPSRQEVRLQLAALARELFWIRAGIQYGDDKWATLAAIEAVEDELLALRDKLREDAT